MSEEQRADSSVGYAVRVVTAVQTIDANACTEQSFRTGKWTINLPSIAGTSGWWDTPQEAWENALELLRPNIGKPSASDLDAHAEEAAAKDATAIVLDGETRYGADHFIAIAAEKRVRQRWPVAWLDPKSGLVWRCCPVGEKNAGEDMIDIECGPLGTGWTEAAVRIPELATPFAMGGIVPAGTLSLVGEQPYFAAARMAREVMDKRYYEYQAPPAEATEEIPFVPKLDPAFIDRLRRSIGPGRITMDEPETPSLLERGLDSAIDALSRKYLENEAAMEEDEAVLSIAAANLYDDGGSIGATARQTFRKIAEGATARGTSIGMSAEAAMAISDLLDTYAASDPCSAGRLRNAST